MKNLTKHIMTPAFALALAANSVTVLAQNAPQNPSTNTTQERKVERQVWVNTEGKTFDVQTAEPGRIASVVSTLPQAMTFVGNGGQDGFTYSFVASEVGTSGKVVKGAPYSAEIVNEFVQTLANGNRIVRRNTSNTYRDGEGRTRREQSITPVGVNVAGADIAASKTTIITDPVEGFTYILDEKTKTARRMKMGQPGTFSFTSANGSNVVVAGSHTATATLGHAEEIRKINVSGGVLQGSALSKVQPAYPAEAKAARVSGPVTVAITIGETGEVTAAEATSGHPLLRDAAVTAARQWKFKPTELQGKNVKVQGNLTFNFSLADEPSATNVTTFARGTGVGGAVAAMPANGFPGTFRMRINSEGKATPLGKQTIEGVECEGTRIVETIPAGKIGNEQPIEIVSERWVSAELGLTVLSKHSDPLHGETTVRIANLLRTEPDQYLFKVPSDYTIKESPATFVRTTKPE